VGEKMMKPCKHLDYNKESYPSCELVEIKGFPCPVKHWKRTVVPYEGAPVNVQFCKRGRINGIFQCYNQGEMHCYELLDTDDNE
jgi:hypothetical protein